MRSLTVKTALLSDIHGNSPAVQATLEDIQRAACQKVFMLGDLINEVDPHGCVDMLRTWADKHQVELACIQGNAEAYLNTPDRHLLPKQDEEWNTAMIHLVQWWQDQLTASDLNWIAAFPTTITWHQTLLVHDSPLDRVAVQQTSEIPPQYREWFFHGRGLLPTTTNDIWERTIAHMRASGYQRVFCGHTHVPFLKTLPGGLLCNIGSTGMPLDGDYRPSWVLLENDTVTICRVDYDVSRIHALIDSTSDYYDFKMPGYREAYKKCLATGRHWRDHIRS